MDSNNGDRPSDDNISLDYVEASVTVAASAGGQNGKIEVLKPEGLVVSSLEDENDGNVSNGDLSLRETIALASEREGADRISFDNNLADGAIALTDSLWGYFELNHELLIDSLDQNNLTLDGGFIFKVAANVDVTIDGYSSALLATTQILARIKYKIMEMDK